MAARFCTNECKWDRNPDSDGGVYEDRFRAEVRPRFRKEPPRYGARKAYVGYLALRKKAEQIGGYEKHHEKSEP
jgi:hypothetical protein